MVKWNEPYNKQHFYTAVEGRVVNLIHKYQPGSGDMLVFYNGIVALRDVDYREVNPYTIEFLFDLEAGDVIACQLQKMW